MDDWTSMENLPLTVLLMDHREVVRPKQAVAVKGRGHQNSVSWFRGPHRAAWSLRVTF